jgi:hypothetical protein
VEFLQGPTGQIERKDTPGGARARLAIEILLLAAIKSTTLQRRPERRGLKPFGRIILLFENCPGLVPAPGNTAGANRSLLQFFTGELLQVSIVPYLGRSIAVQRGSLRSVDPQPQVCWPGDKVSGPLRRREHVDRIACRLPCLDPAVKHPHVSFAVLEKGPPDAGSIVFRVIDHHVRVIVDSKPPGQPRKAVGINEIAAYRVLRLRRGLVERAVNSATSNPASAAPT